MELGKPNAFPKGRQSARTVQHAVGKGESEKAKAGR